MIFNAQLEQTVVTVHWLYDRDDHGIYNTYVDKVIYKGVDVMPVLPDESLELLDAEGHKRWEEEQFHD
jgi:hypothetical protein